MNRGPGSAGLAGRAAVVVFAAGFAALATATLGGAPACVLQPDSIDASIDVTAEAAVVECDLSGDCDTCQQCVLMLGACTKELKQCDDGPACNALSVCLRGCDIRPGVGGSGASGGSGGAGGAGGGGGAGGFDIAGCKTDCCSSIPAGIAAYEAAQTCSFGISCPISCVGRTFHCP